MQIKNHNALICIERWIALEWRIKKVYTNKDRKRDLKQVLIVSSYFDKKMIPQNDRREPDSKLELILQTTKKLWVRR